ncbi:MAG: type II secretion system protein [Candidatus Harrisonbacteria bacterium]|nr:type II secretion system protein [Candidatus Harrisonbacteria bacterium]
MKNERAFTLIEILVILSIMTMLVGMTFTYSNRGGQQITLFREKARVMQEILRAKSLAITLYKETEERICGYGVHFPQAAGISERRTIILFKDLPVDDECSEFPAYSGVSELIDEHTLPENIRFFNPTETIFFQPPIPTIYFNGLKAGQSEALSEARVELRLNDSNDSTFITVNALGQVNAE